jgi:hypothetical protein
MMKTGLASLATILRKLLISPFSTHGFSFPLIMVVFLANEFLLLLFLIFSSQLLTTNMQLQPPHSWPPQAECSTNFPLSPPLLLSR